MSYDIKIKVKVEGCKVYKTIASPMHNSPTYNLRGMFVACTDWDYEQGEVYKCSEIIDKINTGIFELKTNRKKYEDYNPVNGWGNIDGAILTLESIRDCVYEQAEETPIECLYICW